MKTIFSKQFIQNNIKYIIASVIAIILIVINGSILIEKLYTLKNPSIFRQPINHLFYYGKEIIPLQFKNANGNSITIPNNQNYIILGINNAPIKYMTKQLKSNKDNLLRSYSVIVIYVTSQRIPKDSFIYQYNDLVLGGYFHLSNFINFTLAVDKNNTIRFFKYDLINDYEIELLMKKLTGG